MHCLTAGKKSPSLLMETFSIRISAGAITWGKAWGNSRNSHWLWDNSIDWSGILSSRMYPRG
jgi:hypothetical protein